MVGEGCPEHLTLGFKIQPGRLFYKIFTSIYEPTVFPRNMESSSALL
jgi:hypothetical protein